MEQGNSFRAAKIGIPGKLVSGSKTGAVDEMGEH